MGTFKWRRSWTCTVDKWFVFSTNKAVQFAVLLIGHEARSAVSLTAQLSQLTALYVAAPYRTRFCCVSSEKSQFALTLLWTERRTKRRIHVLFVCQLCLHVWLGRLVGASQCLCWLHWNLGPVCGFQQLEPCPVAELMKNSQSPLVISQPLSHTHTFLWVMICVVLMEPAGWNCYFCCPPAVRPTAVYLLRGVSDKSWARASFLDACSHYKQYSVTEECVWWHNPLSKACLLLMGGLCLVKCCHTERLIFGSRYVVDAPGTLGWE